MRPNIELYDVKDTSPRMYVYKITKDDITLTVHLYERDNSIGLNRDIMDSYIKEGRLARRIRKTWAYFIHTQKALGRYADKLREAKNSEFVEYDNLYYPDRLYDVANFEICGRDLFWDYVPATVHGREFIVSEIAHMLESGETVRFDNTKAQVCYE